MDANSRLLALLLISALLITVQAAESVSVSASPSDSIQSYDFSDMLKVVSKRTTRLTPPPSPKIRAPYHLKSPPPSPRPPPPPRCAPSPPPPRPHPSSLWQPPV
ncbi:hypothetical protein PTKIN_Ptkin01aG0348400 [Pterospermum kingtungense]